MLASKSLESRIVTLQGPGGAFGMARDGGTQEGIRYYYRDSKQRFRFYVEIGSMPAWTINITFAELLDVSHDEAVRIERNIEFYFRTRNVAHPEREATLDTGAKVVTFAWRIAR